MGDLELETEQRDLQDAAGKREINGTARGRESSGGGVKALMDPWSGRRKQTKRKKNSGKNVQWLDEPRTKQTVQETSTQMVKGEEEFEEEEE